MNQNIILGEINALKIARVSEPGLYLCAMDEEEILLPNTYITKEMNIGDILEVFVYTDSEDRLVATTLTPYGYVNDYVCLEVVDLAKFGAFVDLGLPKDLLVPRNRQKTHFNVGDRKVVQIIEDERTHRLIGTEKFQLKSAKKNYKRNDEVEILLFAKTPLGFKVIVDNKYEGMIFHNEVFAKVHVGDRKKAYVKYLRDDGKLDVSLQKIGQTRKSDNQDGVLSILEQNGGEMAFTYKSDAEDIQETFSMSKKAFKAVLTQLLNDEKIILTETTIKLKG